MILLSLSYCSHNRRCLENLKDSWTTSIFSLFFLNDNFTVPKTEAVTLKHDMLLNGFKLLAFKMSHLQPSMFQ